MKVQDVGISSQPAGFRRKQFTTAGIDESVWQQVLKIADKNEDFKRRLRALGLLDREREKAGSMTNAGG